MTLVEIFVLAVALAMDAFSVGAAIGVRHRQPRQIFRLSFHFGLFQALMPLIGALAGALVLTYVQSWDHWVVFSVLGFLGVRMIMEARHEKSEEKLSVDLTKGLRLIGLSIAVSIDALAAGISLALSHAPIALSVTIIGIVAALATMLAMLLANRLSQKFGKYSETVAGLVLILLGTKTLLEHLGVIGGGS